MTRLDALRLLLQKADQPEPTWLDKLLAWVRRPEETA